MWAMHLVAPQHFERCEVPTPDATALDAGQVLLRTQATGVCGTDLPHFRGLRPLDKPEQLMLPAPAGAPSHEVTGVVVASRDDGLAVGDAVVGWASSSNALAEYVVCKGSGLATYNPQLPPQTAVMLQPLACVLAAADRLGVVGGRSVAVLGLGPIGVLFSHVLKSAGARHVTAVDRVDRSDVADTYGVDELVWSSTDRWARTVPDDRRPDIVIEAIGHQSVTLRDSVTAVAPGGTIYYFGMPDDDFYPIPMDRFVRKDLTLIAGLTRDRRRWLAAADAYLRRYPELAAGYVTDLFPIGEVDEAYGRALNPRTGQLKIAVLTDPMVPVPG